MMAVQTNEYNITIERINDRSVIRIPQQASDTLPSRGQAMADGTLNGQPFRTPLEPDGRGGHWFEPSAELLAKTSPNDTHARLTIVPSKEWPEPSLPADLAQALSESPDQRELWNSITPMARWDWIRWIRATNNPGTRAKRIAAAISKMSKGMRRPCCFNRNVCTVPEVSKSGVLLER